MIILKHYELTKTVVESNEIFNSEYYKNPDMELTLEQKKLLTYLVSKIEKDDDEFKLQIISIKDYCTEFGIKGNKYQAIKDSLKNIADKKTFWVKFGEEEELCRWVDRVAINRGRGQIKIKLSESLRPYYLGIKERYTIYQLGYIVKFTSKYSQTIYEFCRRWLSAKKASITYLDARLLWCYGKYDRFCDFNTRVLQPAIDDINKYSDLMIKVTPERHGKQVHALHFYIREKRKTELATSGADYFKEETPSLGEELKTTAAEIYDEEIDYDEELTHLENEQLSSFED